MVSKRKTLCVDEKASLIRAIEKGDKKSDVGRRFGLSSSTVATIWKSKEKILQAERDGKSSKKLRKPKFEDLDQVMLSWFNRQRQNNVPISGPIVKVKAEKFAQLLGITDFKASEGWLGKFKRRHNINYGKMRILQHNFMKDLQTYMEIDEDLAKTSSLTDEEIIDSVTKSEEKQKEDEEEDQADNPEPVPSVRQALDAAKLLGKFLLFYNDPTISQDMDKIHKKIQTKYWCNKKRQTKIKDYI